MSSLKMMTKKNKFSSLVCREDCPDGTAWIQIIENEPGKIEKIIFQIGKAGTSVNSYCFAIAELSTALLNNGYSISNLIDLLVDISSDRAPRIVGDGPINKSGAEALASALRKYMLSISDQENERKPPRLLNRTI